MGTPGVPIVNTPPDTASGVSFVQGGNTFGANAVLGTLDAFPLTFITSGVERARFLTTGPFLVNATSQFSTEQFRTNGAVSISSGAVSVFLEMTDGPAAAVSGATTGRIRYNDATSAFQVSISGAAYVDLATSGNAFIQNGNSFGALATLGTNDAFALAFETSGTEKARILTTGEWLVGVTALSGTEFVRIEDSRDAAVTVRCENLNVGASASARFECAGNAETGFISAEGGIFSLTLSSGATGLFVNSNVASPIIFRTSGVERARMTPTGEFVLGDTATTVLVEFNRSQNSSTLLQMVNTTSGTLAAVGYNIDGEPGDGSLSITSTLFTPSSGVLASEMVLFSSATRIAIMTQSTDEVVIRTTMVDRWEVDANGNFTLTQGVQTSGNPTFYTATSAAHTTLTAAETIAIDFDTSATVEFTTGGVIATQRNVVFRAPVYDATAATQTITTAATVSITGAPTAGSGNLVITNAFALDVTGATRITGKLTVTGSIDPTDITLSGGGTAHFQQWGNGTTAAVSAAGTGRIRYNDTSKTFQISADTGAYADITTGVGAGYDPFTSPLNLTELEI